MTIKIKTMHVYPMPSVEGHPLFEITLDYSTRPFIRLESCTQPGTLTKHHDDFPLQHQYATAETAFKKWALSLTEDGTLQQLYDHFRLPAIRELRELPLAYQGSFPHRVNHRRIHHTHFLTKKQLEALERMGNGREPWVGTDDRERLLQQAKQEQDMAQENEFALTPENVERWIVESGWQPEGREITQYVDDINLSIAQFTKAQRQLPIQDKLCIFWELAQAQHDSGTFYLPPLHLYLHLPEPVRRRHLSIIWRANTPFSAKPWPFDDPYCPPGDEERFLQFAKKFPGSIPVNVREEMKL